MHYVHCPFRWHAPTSPPPFNILSIDESESEIKGGKNRESTHKRTQRIEGGPHLFLVSKGGEGHSHFVHCFPSPMMHENRLATAHTSTITRSPVIMLVVIVATLGLVAQCNGAPVLGGLNTTAADEMTGIFAGTALRKIGTAYLPQDADQLWSTIYVIGLVSGHPYFQYLAASFLWFDVTISRTLHLLSTRTMDLLRSSNVSYIIPHPGALSSSSSSSPPNGTGSGGIVDDDGDNYVTDEFFCAGAQLYSAAFASWVAHVLILGSRRFGTSVVFICVLAFADTILRMLDTAMCSFGSVALSSIIGVCIAYVRIRYYADVIAAQHRQQALWRKSVRRARRARRHQQQQQQLVLLSTLPHQQPSSPGLPMPLRRVHPQQQHDPNVAVT